MRAKVFIDTSALYALADLGDENHARARSTYGELLKQKTLFTLTDHVLAETATLIRRRLGYKAGRAFLQRMDKLTGIGLFTVVFANRERLARARQIFEEIPASRLSFVDALSFAVMRELRLVRFFAFDEHFLAAGFESVDV